MTKAAHRNVLVVQSGGCTPVMNRSLVGVVARALESPALADVYGAAHGLAGILDGSLVGLNGRPGRTWARVANTPGAALGSGRMSLRPDDLLQVLETLDRYRIGYLFTIGGNDSAETAHRIACEGGRVVVHVPKTIDNDLPITDHCPGYGSAARFVALATMGAGRDAEAMGEASPVTVIEVMGRDAGWLAASAALGKREEMDAPHYICLPEVPLDEDGFLARMEEAYRRWAFAVAVTAENARGQFGPLGGDRDPFFVDDFGHEYFEGPGRYLAQLLGRELRVRARFEKPGTIQRSLSACVSSTDAGEATLVGRAAVEYALEGHSDVMVTLVRQPGEGYACYTGLAPLEAVAGKVRPLPSEYIGPPGMMTQAFCDYARPLLGKPLPRYARLRSPARAAVTEGRR